MKTVEELRFEKVTGELYPPREDASRIRINFQTTHQEKREIEAIAKRYNMTVARYLRGLHRAVIRNELAMSR